MKTFSQFYTEEYDYRMCKYIAHEKNYKFFKECIDYVFFETVEEDFKYIKKAESLYYDFINILKDLDYNDISLKDYTFDITLMNKSIKVILMLKDSKNKFAIGKDDKEGKYYLEVPLIDKNTPKDDNIKKYLYESLIKSLRYLNRYNIIHEFAHFLNMINKRESSYEYINNVINGGDPKKYTSSPDEFDAIFNEIINYISDELIYTDTKLKDIVIKLYEHARLRKIYKLIYSTYKNKIDYKILEDSTVDYKKKFLKRLYRAIIDKEFQDLIAMKDKRK